MVAQGDLANAVATLQRSLAKQRNQPQAKMLLASALADQGSTEQARVQLAELIAEQPENMAARKLMARLLVGQGEAGAAEKVLSSAPESVQGDATADWMRSAILSATGQPAAALTALEQAARADRNNASLQLALARAYASAGRQADAKRTLQGIPTQKAGWQARQIQVLQRVYGEPAEKSRDVLAALVGENPDDAELRTVVGQTLAQMGDMAGAKAQFQAALAVSPKLLEARSGLVGIALATNDLPAAKQELQKIVAEQPAAEGAYLALAGIATRERNDKEARQWLEKAISAVPAAVMARVTLAELQYEDNQTAAADALLEQAVNVAGDKVPALLRVGEVQMRSGQPEKAVASFEKAYAIRPQSDVVTHLFAARRASKASQPEYVLREWLQKQPDDPNARGLLAEYLMTQGNHRAAAAEYEQLIRRVSSPVALNNLAWLYQNLGDTRAEATAKRAYDAVPNHPTILDTYGWILLEKGRVTEALPLLTKAAERAPDNAEIRKHLERAQQLAKR
jgi:tetratricopeptide (TPR) repeat protein